LLFAGTEKTVYVSFDDGAQWQSLQANLPPTSIRDLVVHGDDVVVGTHGRSFWILDDIEPLREARTALFAPALAYRVRRDTYTDTPLPPDEPVGANPPDGAIIDYTLGPSVKGPVVLEIDDAAGHLVRTFASTDSPEPIAPDIDVPTYWVKTPQIPSAQPGDHRFVWDLRYAPPASLEHGYPIGAIVHATPRAPEGVLVVPGTYTVRLRANGASYARTFTLAPDPRSSASSAALAEQFRVATQIAGGLDRSAAAFERARARKDTAAAERAARVNGSLARLLGIVEDADAAPTAAAKAAVADVLRGLVAGTGAPDLGAQGEP
jgi:hypothetical protein